MAEEMRADRLTAVETQVIGLVADVAEVKADVRYLRDTLVRRPSWPMVAFITLSTSFNVGLVVALFNHL
jgi:hypothetical protein